MENFENNVSCCRCGETIEPQQHAESGLTALITNLTFSEQSFIQSKFKGPLCLACLNQLKTSYKIINGDATLTAENVTV